PGPARARAAPPRRAFRVRTERDRRSSAGTTRRSRGGAAALLLLPEEEPAADRRERARRDAAGALVGYGALRLLLRRALAELQDEPADDRVPPVDDAHAVTSLGLQATLPDP